MNNNSSQRFFSCLIAVVVSLAWFNPLAGQDLTIYHNNFALYQNVVSVNIPDGKSWYWMRGLPETIDTGSLLLRFPDKTGNIRIKQQKILRQTESRESFLSRSIGNSIEIFFEKGENLNGVLDAVEPAFLIVSGENSNRHIISRDKIVRISAFAPPGKPSVQNSIDAGWEIVNGKSADLSGIVSYILSGLSWKADYIGIYNDDTNMLGITSRAAITNAGNEDIQAENLTLVAGDVRRNRGMQAPMPFRMNKAMSPGAPPSEAAMDLAEREGAYEYYKYKIKEPVILDARSVITKGLMEPMPVTVKKEYVYDGSRSGRNVFVTFSFLNDKKSGAGEPLPSGSISLYMKNEENLLTYIGEDILNSVPVNEKVQLSGGMAFNLTGERRQQEFKRISKDTVEETFEIIIKNGSAEDALVSIVEHVRGDWSVVKNNVPFTKKDANTIEFKVLVKKKASKSLIYSVKIS